MEYTGRIHKVSPVQSGTSANGYAWRRQDFVFEYFEKPEDTYTRKVVLSVMNDRIDQCDIHEGDEVKIDFNFGSKVREYNGKYFHELFVRQYETLRRLEAPQQAPEPEAPANIEFQEEEEKKDDLPF